ncbi:hypothetical protein Tco_0501394, partial [Tanacetum coccineum]
NDPYLDISRIFSNTRTNGAETIGYEPGLVSDDDNGIDYLEE